MTNFERQVLWALTQCAPASGTDVAHALFGDGRLGKPDVEPALLRLQACGLVGVRMVRLGRKAQRKEYFPTARAFSWEEAS